MAKDRIELCQASLDLLGVGDVEIREGGTTNFNSSVSGEICSRHYDRTRRELLRMHQWGFATTTGKLEPIEINHPIYERAYRFPVNCLRIINVHVEGSETGPRVEYVLETQGSTGNVFIFTNNAAEELWHKCIQDIDITTKFDSLFDNCLVLLLASKMALPLGKGADVGRIFLQQFISMMPVATGADAQEGYQPDDLEADWITARS